MTPGLLGALSGRLRRVVVVAAVTPLTVSLVAGLVWFFDDPLHLPQNTLEALDHQASVVAIFTGMAPSVAGLVVAVLALRAQAHAERAQRATLHTPDAPDATPKAPPQVSASRECSIAIGGDNAGLVSTGDHGRNVQTGAEASEQSRAYQSCSDQTVNER